MSIFTYSKEGASHLADGLGNQDALRVMELGDLGGALMVADGMSSALRGEQAANAAVEVALAICTNCLIFNKSRLIHSAKAAIEAAFAAAFNTLYNLAQEEGLDTIEFATTLMVVVWESSGDLAFGYVGDGGIVVYSESNGKRRVGPVTTEQRGMRRGETSSIFSYDDWSFGTCSHVNAFYVATDGLHNVLSTSAEGHREPTTYARSLLAQAAKEPAMGSFSGNSFEDDLLDPQSGELLAPFSQVTDDKTIAIVTVCPIEEVDVLTVSTTSPANNPISTEDNPPVSEASPSSDAALVAKGEPPLPIETQSDVAEAAVETPGYEDEVVKEVDHGPKDVDIRIINTDEGRPVPPMIVSPYGSTTDRYPHMGGSTERKQKPKRIRDFFKNLTDW